VDIGSDRSRLHELFKDLRARWLQVQDEWKDPVQREWDETYWKALEERIRVAMQAMDQLAPVLSQVRHDCS